MLEGRPAGRSRIRDISVAPIVLALAMAGSLALLQSPPAWSADEATGQVHFEGLECGDDAFQVYVAALAASQNLGYEIRDSSTTRRSFEGKLKPGGRWESPVELSVEVTCSGPGLPGFDAFFGPPEVTVPFTVRSKRGPMGAASHEAALFQAQLKRIVDARWDRADEACLGISLRDAASLEPAIRSRLGAEIGAVVTEVHSAGPSAAAGLAPWDVLLGIDGVELTGARGFSQLLREREPGDEVALLLIRDGQTHRVAVSLGRRSDDGTCAVVDAASPEASPPPDGAPLLAIQTVEVTPPVVAAGSPFDVRLALALSIPSSDGAEQEVTVDVEILRDGELLFRPTATSVSCRSGATTEVVRHLRAGNEPGAYDLRVTATAGSLEDRRTASLEIR